MCSLTLQEMIKDVSFKIFNSFEYFVDKDVMEKINVTLCLEVPTTLLMLFYSLTGLYLYHFKMMCTQDVLSSYRDHLFPRAAF